MKHKLQLLFLSTIISCVLFAQQWAPVGQPGFSAGAALYTSMVLGANDTPYIAFNDQAHGGKATVMKYNGSQWVTVGNAGFSAGATGNVTLVVDANHNTLYVGYQDSTHAPFSVMTYNGTGWVYVGDSTLDIVDATAGNFCLAISASDTLYAGYTVTATNEMVKAKKFDGSHWVPVGSPIPLNFSSASQDPTSIAVDRNGVPYLAYGNVGNGGGDGLEVSKLVDTGWVLQGPGVISAGNSFGYSMAFNSNNTPMIAFTDEGLNTNGMTTVDSFNGTNWDSIGPRGFSDGFAFYDKLALTPAGVPVIAYTTLASEDYVAIVQYFNGTNWVYYGTGRISDSIANYCTLAISPTTGKVYIGYVDYAHGQAATVMSCGEATGFAHINPGAACKIYPNPNNGNFTLRIETTENTPVTLMLADLAGHEVWSTELPEISGAFTIQPGTAGLSPGVYFLEMKTVGGINTQRVEITK